jgi:hypothetical protein
MLIFLQDASTVFLVGVFILFIIFLILLIRFFSWPDALTVRILYPLHPTTPDSS